MGRRRFMKFKDVKKLVIKYFSIGDISIKFGWKFRVYPQLRRQMKQWAKEILEENKTLKKDKIYEYCSEQIDYMLDDLEKKGSIQEPELDKIDEELDKYIKGL